MLSHSLNEKKKKKNAFTRKLSHLQKCPHIPNTVSDLIWNRLHSHKDALIFNQNALASPSKKMFTFPQNTTAFLLNALVFTKTHSHLQQNKKRAHKNPCIRIKSNLILKKFLLSFKMNRIRNALAFTQNAQIPTKIACVPIQRTCIPMKHSHIHTEWTCITTKYSHSQKAPSRLHKMLRFPQKHTRIHTKRTCNPTKHSRIYTMYLQLQTFNSPKPYKTLSHFHRTHSHTLLHSAQFYLSHGKLYKVRSRSN